MNVVKRLTVTTYVKKMRTLRKERLSKGGVDTKRIKCPADEIALDFLMAGEAGCTGRRRFCKDGLARLPNRRCRQCPPGFFGQTLLYVPGDETDGDACIPISRGSFTPRTGSSKCMPCPKQVTCSETSFLIRMSAISANLGHLEMKFLRDALDAL